MEKQAFETLRIPVEELSQTVQIELRDSIAGRVSSFWQVLDMVKDANGHIAQPQYCQFNRCMQRALNPASNKEESIRVALDDWARDLRRSISDSAALDLQGFYECVYELCAYWAEGHTIEQYQHFLDTLLRAITRPDGKGLRWADIDQINPITSGKPPMFRGAKKEPNRLAQQLIRGPRAAVRKGPIAFGSRMASPPKTARSRSVSSGGGARMLSSGSLETRAGQNAAPAVPVIGRTSSRGVNYSGADAGSPPRRPRTSRESSAPAACLVLMGAADRADASTASSLARDGTLQKSAAVVTGINCTAGQPVNGSQGRRTEPSRRLSSASGQVGVPQVMHVHPLQDITRVPLGERRGGPSRAASNVALSEALTGISCSGQQQASVPQVMRVHPLKDATRPSRAASNAALSEALTGISCSGQQRASVPQVMQSDVEAQPAGLRSNKLLRSLSMPTMPGDTHEQPISGPIPPSVRPASTQKYGRRARRGSLPESQDKPQVADAKSNTAPTPLSGMNVNMIPQPPSTAVSNVIRRRRRASLPEMGSEGRDPCGGSQTDRQLETSSYKQFSFDGPELEHTAQTNRVATKLRLMKSRVHGGELLADRWAEAQNRAWTGSAPASSDKLDCPWLNEKVTAMKGRHGAIGIDGGVLQISSCAVSQVE